MSKENVESERNPSSVTTVVISNTLHRCTTNCIGGQLSSTELSKTGTKIKFPYTLTQPSYTCINIQHHAFAKPDLATRKCLMFEADGVADRLGGGEDLIDHVALMA
ncbi:hypothetical protein SNOG_01556 [Parastagonospora nodorum SN15]|uniref:Uncharacterized protein n=1 Tax=Phaeosphaeria nodorum (strain SN15 / ATCC MYA-4574 / FGSC 10173) TaxID=321614 RepID=Q0V358_PHANO|nr:hypothetical protein SNOG_01556 [Parastagonospora nodorum SN15]EAT91205.1 hypothetical protein SNOG_01556 [Parastagonospora nodorum SN15]